MDDEEVASAAELSEADGILLVISDASVKRGIEQNAAIEAAKKRVMFVPLGLYIFIFDRLFVMRRSAVRRYRHDMLLAVH